MSELYRKCNNASNGSAFVGIEYKNNDIKITFPMGYEIPNNDSELKKAIISLIKSINLTRKDTTKNEASDFFEEKPDIPFYSYYSLINDYLLNGLYRVKEKEYKIKGNGKINWKRTIQKITPCFNKDNNLIYLNFVSEKTRILDNLITEIQKYCLGESLKYFGWYFGNVSVPKSIFTSEDKERMKQILKKELGLTFQDKKKIFLNHMLDILTGLDKTKKFNTLNVCGTKYYHVVWEKMLSGIFCNVEISDYYPTAFYVMKNGINKEASNLRPDFIHYDYENKKFYILDAKYYNYCTNYNKNDSIRGLPGSDSIQKQITYAEHIHKNKNYPGSSDQVDGNSIYNAFILPYNKKSNKNISINEDNIAYYTYAYCDWVPPLDDGKEYKYHRIAVIFMDTKYVIEKWLSNDKTSINQLKEIVNENI